jgi:membrane fusion protein (multidrug efflux system)
LFFKTIMKRKIALAAVLVLAIAGGLAAIKTLQVKTLLAAVKTMPTPSESVAPFIVREEQWQGTLAAIATATAAQGVIVTPEVPGLVREIAFESGAVVAKGDLLVRLDVSSEEAQLRAMEAQLQLAYITLDRERTLRKENMVSQSELDTAEATVKQFQANADTIRTTIEKKAVRAPFAGRLGVRYVNLGQNLEVGKPIVSLQSLSPIFVDFSLPPQELAPRKTGRRVRLTTDAYRGRQFEGTLTTINPDLDQSTRSVGLQATFQNPDELLRPGMFARVEVLLPDVKTVLAIPLTAVLSAPYGESVFVIETQTVGQKTELTVRQKFIRTGPPRGDFVSVQTGLKAGEKIVGAGLFKLRTGMAVVESNELTPKISETPAPSDT